MGLVAEPGGRVCRYKNRREGWALGPALATELHPGYVAGVGYEARGLVVMSGEAERVGCIATGGQLNRGYAKMQGNQQDRHEALRGRAVDENRVGVMLFASQYRGRGQGVFETRARDSCDGVAISTGLAAGQCETCVGLGVPEWKPPAECLGWRQPVRGPGGIIAGL